MPNTKYGDLISRNITKKSKHPQVKGPKIEFGGADFNGGNDLDISWYSPSEPFSMNDKIHTHEFDEFLCFLSASPNEMNDYQAEIEISLGEDEKKYVLTEPAVICLPKGFPHGQLGFKKIVKPFSYMKICLSPRYSTTQPVFKTRYEEYITNLIVSNDRIKQCFFLNERLIGQEERTVKKLTYSGKESNGVNLTIHWFSIKENLVLYHPTHSHAYKQYELFMGGNLLDVEDFDSEVEISLGDEAETHVIDSTTMVHIKEDLVHRQINFKRVGKPLIFVNFSLDSGNQR